MASKNEKEFDVFCSYQWDIKSDIEHLHKNLESAVKDLRIWRDVNELRNNNVGLFKQLGKNIIGSKIFLCCLTKKYTKSENCLRELNFAAKMSKPIIYLMIEKMNVDQLDPEVAFIMGNAVYIQCYKNPTNWFESGGNLEEITDSINDELEVKIYFFFNAKID
jgi:hypothetical protein